MKVKDWREVHKLRCKIEDKQHQHGTPNKQMLADCLKTALCVRRCTVVQVVQLWKKLLQVAQEQGEYAGMCVDDVDGAMPDLVWVQKVLSTACCYEWKFTTASPGQIECSCIFSYYI